LPGEWNNSIIMPIYKTGDKKILLIIGAYKRKLCTKSYPTYSVQAKSTCSRKYWESSVLILTQQVNTDNIFCIR